MQATRTARTSAAPRRFYQAMNGWALAGTSFLASGVEAVEAMTIVLAVGITRSWPVALRGTALGLLVLIAIVAILGPLLQLFPIELLKTVVGIVLLRFGTEWLWKAILRYAGRKALRDEDAAFAREVSQLRAVEERRADTIGFVTAFKSVLLEGLEVAVIVVTFGAGSTVALGWAGAGAAGAVVLVALAGIALRRPASRVPENAMKFVVGIMLLSFATFWIGEGFGVRWWGGDLALFALALLYLAGAGTLIAAMRVPRLSA